MNTTPSLIVCVVPEPRPSQSNVVVLIVVLAVTVDVEFKRNRPVPEMVGPARTLADARLIVPLSTTTAPAFNVVVQH